MISGSRLHQEAHPVEACPAVPDFHIQPAVLLAVVARLRQIGTQLIRPGRSNTVDLFGHRGIRRFHVPQFDLRLVFLCGDLCLIGYFVAFLQSFRQGGADRSRKQADYCQQSKRSSDCFSHHIPSHIPVCLFRGFDSFCFSRFSVFLQVFRTPRFRHVFRIGICKRFIYL